MNKNDNNNITGWVIMKSSLSVNQNRKMIIRKYNFFNKCFPNECFPTRGELWTIQPDLLQFK